MTDEAQSELKPCPLCGAELLPDEVTKTNEVVVWRHAYNACLLNGALPGIRVPHDVEAWNRRPPDTPVSVGEADIAKALAAPIDEGVDNYTVEDVLNLHPFDQDKIIRAILRSTRSRTGGREAGLEVTDAMVKRAAYEFLSHRGEHPDRTDKWGSELWEQNAPAMRAALTAALLPQHQKADK